MPRFSRITLKLFCVLRRDFPHYAIDSTTVARRPFERRYDERSTIFRGNDQKLRRAIEWSFPLILVEARHEVHLSTKFSVRRTVDGPAQRKLWRVMCLPPWADQGVKARLAGCRRLLFAMEWPNTGVPDRTGVEGRDAMRCDATRANECYKVCAVRGPRSKVHPASPAAPPAVKPACERRRHTHTLQALP